MSLTVIASMPEAAITAAWASSCAGEPVTLIGGPDELLDKPLRVMAADRSSTALLRAPQRDGAFGGDACILLARRAETLQLVDRYRDYLAGRPLLIVPGAVGLVEQVSEQFEKWGLPVPVLGHLPGFPLIGSVVGTDIQIRAVKRQVPLGARTIEMTEQLCAIFRRWIPDLVPSSLALTSLSITNNIVHPPVVLVNGARIESGDTFLFYREGLSPGAVRIIEEIDRERLAILDKLGLPLVALVGWMRRYYGDQGMVGRDVGELMHTFPAFGQSKGPNRLTHRYLTEDVAYGLAPLEAVGSAVGAQTPVLSAVITTVGCLLGMDPRATASSDASRLLQHVDLDPTGSAALLKNDAHSPAKPSLRTS
jgi:opine dehydrogenase